MGTSTDAPSDGDSGERMMKIFEEEMRLGPNLNNHIPAFIAEGLAMLRTIPTTTPAQET